MELTERQLEGLQICLERYRNQEPYTVIAGYAGTGKSTLVKFIVAALEDYGVPESKIQYAAYTGKAAQVLIDKGNSGAMTLHRLLYKHVPLPDGSYFRERKDISAKVVIVDECSMLPKEMADELIRDDAYIIFCGDPGQLPPVSRDDENGLLDNPHVFLDTVMRQALDSDIIRLSMEIRNGNNIESFDGKDAKVITMDEFSTGMLEWADIVLCATNKTRIALNAQMRELRGYTKPVEKGEKLICLTNNWDCLSDNGAALTNGVIGTLMDYYETFNYVPKWLGVPNNKINYIVGHFISETGEDFGELRLDKKCLLTGEPTLDKRQKIIMSRNKKLRHKVPEELTYGYCITGHKAQGSSWEKVLVIEESFPTVQEEHKRWLYTVCTRPSSRLVVVKKG